MKLLLVGQISTPEEAKDLEFTTKLFIVGNRARELSKRSRK